DAVAHLAQSRAHRQGLEGAADLFAVNVAATFRLLHWAKGAGVRRFLFASSATVYRPQSGRLTEASPCAPSGFYAASKLAAEQLLTLADIAQRVGAAMGRTPSLTVTDAPPVHLAGDSAAVRALLPGFRSFDAALPALLA